MQVRARPAHPDVTWTARTVAGRYRPDRLLGRGGAADAFEALDLRLRRPVAVKPFRPAGAHRTDAHWAARPRGRGGAPAPGRGGGGARTGAPTSPLPHANDSPKNRA